MGYSLGIKLGGKILLGLTHGAILKRHMRKSSRKKGKGMKSRGDQAFSL